MSQRQLHIRSSCDAVVSATLIRFLFSRGCATVDWLYQEFSFWLYRINIDRNVEPRFVGKAIVQYAYRVGSHTLS